MWEGIRFGEDCRERDRLLICLLYCTGYDHLFSILDPESLAILKHAVQKITSTHPNFKDTLRYLKDRDKALSDHVSRMQVAEEEGMRRERNSLVKKLLEEGYPIEDIAKWNGMTVEQLKELNELSGLRFFPARS